MPPRHLCRLHQDEEWYYTEIRKSETGLTANVHTFCTVSLKLPLFRISTWDVNFCSPTPLPPAPLKMNLGSVIQFYNHVTPQRCRVFSRWKSLPTICGPTLPPSSWHLGHAWLPCRVKWMLTTRPSIVKMVYQPFPLLMRWVQSLEDLQRRPWKERTTTILFMSINFRRWSTHAMTSVPCTWYIEWGRICTKNNIWNTPSTPISSNTGTIVLKFKVYLLQGLHFKTACLKKWSLCPKSQQKCTSKSSPFCPNTFTTRKSHQAVLAEPVMRNGQQTDVYTGPSKDSTCSKPCRLECTADNEHSLWLSKFFACSMNQH